MFDVCLICFVNFILCPTDKYMFKVNNKKISIICWMCSKLKPNTTWHRFDVFIVDFDQSVCQCSVSTFNFEQVFVSRVWKKSHNVLKIQKGTYLFRNKSCKAYFIQRFIVAPNWNKSWINDHNEHIINICFSSKFALRIPSVLSLFRSAIWSALWSLFPRDFCFFAGSKMKSYLNYWISDTDLRLVGT